MDDFVGAVAHPLRGEYWFEVKQLCTAQFAFPTYGLRIVHHVVDFTVGHKIFATVDNIVYRLMWLYCL